MVKQRKLSKAQRERKRTMDPDTGQWTKKRGGPVKIPPPPKTDVTKGTPGRSPKRNAMSVAGHYLSNLDGRDKSVIRFKRIYNNICIDKGGEPYLSFMERSLAAAIAGLTVTRERMDQQMLEQDPTLNMVLYTMIQNAQLRAMTKLGIKRTLKPVGDDSLEGYLDDLGEPDLD